MWYITQRVRIKQFWFRLYCQPLLRNSSGFGQQAGKLRLKVKRSVIRTTSHEGEFTQYPFFVRFRPFFYVFASPRQSMRFFIRIFMCPYPH